MNFIALVKWKGKPNGERIEENLRIFEAESKEGVRYLNIYWTLGRYDAVALFEAPDEKAAMQIGITPGNLMDIETLVAVPAEEARRLVDQARQAADFFECSIRGANPIVVAAFMADDLFSRTPPLQAIVSEDDRQFELWGLPKNQHEIRRP